VTENIINCIKEICEDRKLSVKCGKVTNYALKTRGESHEYRQHPCPIYR
jgi:hypothetical protein